MFGPLLIAYLFLGGTAGGGYLVMCLWSLFFRRAATAGRFTLRQMQSFDALQVRAHVLFFVILVMSVICLWWDLGRPTRALLIMVTLRPTILTFGFFVLSIELVLGALLMMGSAFGLGVMQGKLKTVVEILCCITSIATVTYTGIFLFQGASVYFWDSWSLVFLFFFSSLSNGLSLLLLVDYFTGQAVYINASRFLQITHLICLVAELITLVIFALINLNNPAAYASCMALMSKEMLPNVVVGVGLFGIIIPVAMEMYSLIFKECRAVPVSDVLCLCGGCILRYCIIVGGLSQFGVVG